MAAMVAALQRVAWLALLFHACVGLPVVKRAAPGPGTETSPTATANVHCSSTKGPFTIEMHPEWAPIGGQRFIDLVTDGALDGTAIYRVVRNHKGGPEAVQFGFLKDPKMRRKYRRAKTLADDPQIFSKPNFHSGMISFAGGGANTRRHDFFVTFMTGNANGTPRSPWETPFGIIDEAGLKAIGNFGGTGDLRFLGGNAPDMGKGYEALKKSHPDIDYLKKCEIVPIKSKTRGADAELQSAKKISEAAANPIAKRDAVKGDSVTGRTKEPRVGIVTKQPKKRIGDTKPSVQVATAKSSCGTYGCGGLFNSLWMIAQKECSWNRPCPHLLVPVCVLCAIICVTCRHMSNRQAAGKRV